MGTEILNLRSQVSNLGPQAPYRTGTGQAAAKAALGSGPARSAKAAQGDPGAANPLDKRLRKACQDFEAIFLRYLLQKMRDSVPKGGLFGTSQGEEIFRSMLDGSLADEMAKSGSLGLGGTLYNQLARVVLEEPGSPGGGEAGLSPRDPEGPSGS